MLDDPSRFMMRYAAPIQSYVGVIIHNRHDAEEVIQDFLVRVMTHGFAGATPGRGRFRDYLKAAVRNAAAAHLRKAKASQLRQEQSPAEPPKSTEDAAQEFEQHWVQHWRQCVLDRAWR